MIEPLNYKVYFNQLLIIQHEVVKKKKNNKTFDITILDVKCFLWITSQNKNVSFVIFIFKIFRFWKTLQMMQTFHHLLDIKCPLTHTF